MATPKQPENTPDMADASTKQDAIVYNQGSETRPEACQQDSTGFADFYSARNKQGRNGSSGVVAATPANESSVDGAKSGVAVTAKDMQLLERVVRHAARWEVPDHARHTLPATMIEIATNESNKISHRIAAARVIAQLDALNLSEEKHQTPRVNVNVNLTDDARNAKLAALLGNQRLLPSANQSDTPATPAE